VLVEIMLEAGLPPEVIQLVHGLGEEVGAAIVSHPDIPVISFTGSTDTGRIVGEICGRMHKRLSLEMGGKNAQIVMDDADLELALEGALWGAFGTTGQRCTATSRLILHRKIHDKFLGELSSKASAMKLGDGRKKGTDVGPLISNSALEKVQQYVEIGAQDGAELVTGGKRATKGALKKGNFYEPTIFAGVEACGIRLIVLNANTPPARVKLWAASTCSVCRFKLPVPLSRTGPENWAAIGVESAEGT
jgi:aldehyde dehydrogenase (NAD+)